MGLGSSLIVSEMLGGLTIFSGVFGLANEFFI